MFENITKITDFLWGTPLTLFGVIVGLYLLFLLFYYQLMRYGH